MVLLLLCFIWRMFYFIHFLYCRRQCLYKYRLVYLQCELDSFVQCALCCCHCWCKIWKASTFHFRPFDDERNKCWRWYTAVISHNAHNVALFLCFNISFAFCALRCAVDASVCDDNRFDIYFPRIFMHTINGKWLFWFDGGCCYWDHRDTKRLLWTKGKFTYQTRIKMKCILIYSVLTWSKQAKERKKKRCFCMCDARFEIFVRLKIFIGFIRSHIFFY